MTQTVKPAATPPSPRLHNRPRTTPHHAAPTGAAQPAAVLGIPLLWLLLFLLLPLLLVLKISLSAMGAVQVEELVSLHDGHWQLNAQLDAYRLIASDALYWKTALASLRYATLATLVCLVVGYPFAWCLTRLSRHLQALGLLLVMLPFWTSLLLRVYAWKGLLSDHGAAHTLITRLQLDHGLAAWGWVAAPGQLLNSPFSLVVGMVYSYLPFMVLPLYANLRQHDPRLLEAAADLGASPWSAFWRITVPLSHTGVIAGAMLVFIPCAGEFVIPELLGGPQTLMLGRVLWDELFTNNDWPVAAALAVVAVLLILAPLLWFGRSRAAALGDTPQEHAT